MDEGWGRMKQTITMLAMLALLFWSRIASAQTPDSSCSGTRAEVEIVAVSQPAGLCGYVIVEAVTRVRVVRTISGPRLPQIFLAAILCPHEPLRVGTQYEAFIEDRTIPVDVRLDRFNDDRSPRISASLYLAPGRPARRARSSRRRR